MADQLKEIATATITPEDLTGNQFSGTLFTTDANTQYHATEITLGGTLPIAADIEVNNFKATQITQEQKGSAIIDVNSSVRLAFQSPVEFTQEHFNLAVSSGTGDIRDIFAVNGVEVKQQRDILGNDSVINVNRGGLFSKSSSGSIFYHTTDLGSTTTLSRFAGGSVTVINSDTHRPKAFDGSRYYYWINSTRNGIQRYDIETETTTTINLTATLGSHGNYPRLVFSDGLLLYIPDTSTNPAVIDLSTGRVANIIGISGVYGAALVNVGFYFDRETRACAIFSWASTSQIRKATFTAPDFTANVTIGGAISPLQASNFFTPSFSNAFAASMCATGLNTFISTSNGLVYEYDYNTPAALRLIGAMDTGTGRTAFYVNNPVASPTSTDFPVTAKVRFAGVETTI